MLDELRFVRQHTPDPPAAETLLETVTVNAARALGLSVDIVPPDTRDLSDYKLIMAPGMIHMPKSLKADLASCGAAVIIGPRSACRTENMQITLPLPPDLPGFDTTVTQVESLRPDMGIALEKGGCFQHYFSDRDLHPSR